MSNVFTAVDTNMIKTNGPSIYAQSGIAVPVVKRVCSKSIIFAKKK